MGLTSIFSWVLRTSMIASVLAGLILLIKATFGKRMGIRWQYAIWWILIIRLLLPVTLPSPLSIFNLFNTTASNIYIGSGQTLYDLSASVNNLIDPVNLVDSTTANKTVETQEPFNAAFRLISFAWLAGVVFLLLFTLRSNIKLRVKIKKQRQVTAPVLTRLLWECCFKLGITRDIPILQTDAVRSPALYGFIRPCLLMPVGIEKLLDQDELCCVFIHELSHLRRGDILCNWILGILQILHWFNPLLWYSFRRMRLDREIACDTLALSVIAPEERVKYGTTIINLLRNFCKPTRMTLLTGMLDSKTQVKKRITAIANFSKHPYRWTVSAIIVLLITGFLVLTGAKVDQYNDWTRTRSYKRIDRVNYPFLNDPQVIGKWQAVDFVRVTKQFEPGKTQWRDGLFLKTLYFSSGGKMPISSYSWTKGLVLDKYYRTASHYSIQELQGQTYMFFEWKSGDYTLRGMQPQYYVLKKIDDHDYKLADIPRKIDKLDYPFVNDADLIGKWKSVDFVTGVDQFYPEWKSLDEDLYLKKLQFFKNGLTPDRKITWTKGLVINRNAKTASKYIIKTINGTKYLFFEWKSGDYVYRGMKPYYYVLKKIN